MSIITDGRRNRVGRPRHLHQESPMPPREQILDAAAMLFTKQGFANTSTREIADVVGIRQASLYYHFAGKPEILSELLAKSIRPTLDQADLVINMTEDPATALYILVLLDIQTLADAPRNCAILGLMPDVMTETKEYSEARAELGSAYAHLGARVATRKVLEEAGPQLGSLLLENVETAINWRTEGPLARKSYDVLASTCLRICGADDDTIDAARAAAHILLPEVVREVTE